MAMNRKKSCFGSTSSRSIRCWPYSAPPPLPPPGRFMEERHDSLNILVDLETAVGNEKRVPQHSWSAHGGQRQVGPVEEGHHQAGQAENESTVVLLTNARVQPGREGRQNAKPRSNNTPLRTIGATTGRCRVALTTICTLATCVSLHNRAGRGRKAG